MRPGKDSILVDRNLCGELAQNTLERKTSHKERLGFKKSYSIMYITLYKPLRCLIDKNYNSTLVILGAATQAGSLSLSWFWYFSVF